MDNSPLRKLPAELRNYVYELVLYNDGFDWFVSSSRQRPAFLDRDENNTKPLALTQTCRAIRQETSGTFFAINRCAFTVSSCEATLEVWQLRATIGVANDQAIRHIKISTDIQDCECHHWKAERCMTCFYFLKDLKRLYEWSVAQHVVVDLVLRPLHPAAIRVPVDLTHICTSDRAETPCYMTRYEEAWIHGWGLGDWEDFEELTGLERPTDEVVLLAR